MQHDIKIDFDLENTPLEMKTDSETGSSEKVDINFFNQQDDYAGGVKISFTSPPTYFLIDCSLYADNHFSAVPTTSTDVNKVWRITLTKISSVTGDTKRLVIHRDDMVVLKVELSDTVCKSDLSTNWNRDVTKIKFTSADSASDFYRIYTPGWVTLLSNFFPFLIWRIG